MAKPVIHCPYCDDELPKVPLDISGCPKCGQVIRVIESLLGDRKVLLTQEGWAKIYRPSGREVEHDYFTARLQELRGAFEKAMGSTIHYGERGRELESLVRGFIDEYLPRKYSLHTGFVRSLEKQGWQSNQIDILVCRSDICYPIAVHREFSVYPLESLISFIEVTSNLTRGKLREDYEKVAVLQRLHKRMYFLPRPPAGVRPYYAFDTAVHPRYYTFAFSTRLSPVQMRDSMLSLSNEYHTQLHCMFVLQPGYCIVMSNANRNVQPSYQVAEIIDNPRDAIVAFLEHLLSALQTADFIPPNASLPFSAYYDPSFTLPERSPDE